MTQLQAAIRLQRCGFALNADFSVPAGGICALFGPSGAGKSTVLKALAGLQTCEGRIALGTRICTDSKAGVFVPAHRRGFGLVFQDARLFPHLSVRQNLAYAQRRAPTTRWSLAEVADFFQLTALLDRPVPNLSGGEKSRVALARALLGAPDYLLLDEPFAALDGQRRRAFITALLAAHARFQMPMMVVTHAIDDAVALAGHIIGLSHGQIVAQGPFASAAAETSFQDLLDARDVGCVMPPAAMAGVRNSSLNGIWLRADHVLISISLPQGLSARNIFPGELVEMRQETGDSILASIRMGAGIILARVTPEAVRELSLSPGKAVWALVKAHAL